ncbi:Golgi-associated plant pathogenesis-related protein 1-like isoform X2 [Scleropages formosus]|uniref:Golgi-associated plant pathogenesis-related protein 1-like n=1 Tax=Scleropages formosus TaxID=113540 RepID=A0A8C9RZ68_SCLFO|nr:Golgi-associated plant pathogenesis-related protein 1-like isoform X2 [Scleropages formosus]
MKRFSGPVKFLKAIYSKAAKKMHCRPQLALVKPKPRPLSGPPPGFHLLTDLWLAYQDRNCRDLHLHLHLVRTIPQYTARCDASFKKEFLDAHNAYRRKHSAPGLTLSRELCSSAQEWADQLLAMKTMQHSSTKHGENLYYAWSSTPKKLTGKEAVDNWYNEIKDYDFSNPGFHSNTGHFTQVVWKDTKEVGVGVATDGQTVFVVGQYSPAGNISNDGFFEKNVLPAE